MQGISTRSVDSLVQALGMEGISKSQVSRLCGEIDERVGAFLSRPIEGEWPYLWLDATYVKARRDHRIVSVAVIVAVAVNTDGRREVLGMTVGDSEAEPFRTEFLRSLRHRGLRGVKLVVSDAHDELKAAITKVLNATWQRCRFHFIAVGIGVPGVQICSNGAWAREPATDARASRTPRNACASVPPIRCITLRPIGSGPGHDELGPHHPSDRPAIAGCRLEVQHRPRGQRRPPPPPRRR